MCTMTRYVVVGHQVQDYSKWKRVFDESEKLRSEYGLGAGCIYRDIDNPQMLTVLLECLDVERAREFTMSRELKDAMSKGGVIGAPMIWFVEQIADVPALAATGSARGSAGSREMQSATGEEE